jgi:hypothetical protein
MVPISIVVLPTSWTTRVMVPPEVGVGDGQRISPVIVEEHDHELTGAVLAATCGAHGSA